MAGTGATGPARSAHYFDPGPSVASKPRELELVVGTRTLAVTADAGTFSADRIDPGTLVLLRSAPDPPTGGDLLDLGCGYGPIALSLAVRSPAARVWAVDVNERALGLVRANAATNDLPNVTACAPDDVPADVAFTAIWSNPPIRIGKPALHELLLHWLPRLVPGGEAWMVVGKHLGSDSLARWLDEQGFSTTRVASRQAYRTLRVTKPTASRAQRQPESSA